MQGLYKPRAGHTAGTAVSRMDGVSSVVFRSQQKGTSLLLLHAFFQCNYTVSQFHTLTLSLQWSRSVFKLLHLTSPPKPVVFICLSRKWWWVANLTWFPLTLTSRVAGPAATSGPELWFSQSGLGMGLAIRVGLGALMLPYVPGL